MRQSFNIFTSLVIAAGALAAASSGCELIAAVDRGKIEGHGGGGAGGTGGQTGSTSLSTSTTATGGTGGTTTSSTSTSSSSSSTSSTTSSSSTTTTTPTCPTTGGTTCQVAGDCPAAAVCTHATCDTQNCCGVENDTLGTSAPPTSQTAGDCQVVVCDGNGATKTQVDDNDVPADANECSTGTCKLGTPGQSNKTAGTACTSGGKLCDGAGACVECLADGDCTADPLKSHCSSHACVTAQCTDQVKDGLETDTDCGGGPASGCSPCADGLHCVVNTDCGSLSICKAGVCAAATCTDGVKDGTETDLDCGGAACRTASPPALCANGKVCAENGDCTSTFCNTSLTPKVCAAPACNDGFQNGNEADVDCGNACGPTKLCALTQKCNDAADCDSGVCDATKHCAQLPTGQGTCTADKMCASAFCALPEGICCATACGGACQACSAAKTGGTDGTCAPVTAGTDPDNECNDEGSTTCGTTGMCNGSGACALYASGTTCGSASCGTGPLLNLAQTCNGTGTCTTPSPATQDCSPYNCANGACPTSCAADANCVSPFICLSSGTATPLKCGARLSNGAACGAANDCTSTWCYGTPSVCQADSCSDGAKDGTESDVDCGGATCVGLGKTCADGLLCGQPTDCTSAYCNPNGRCSTPSCSDGFQNQDEGDVDCGGVCAALPVPKLCAVGQKCNGSGDCSSQVCDATGHCGTLADGQACSLDAQCTNGHCVEGVCCNAACSGTCESCRATKTGGANGSCLPVTGGTDPDGECADLTASTCGTSGMCNGARACALWPSGTQCTAASCGTGPTLNLAHSCDGSGACTTPTPATQDCSPYNCAAGACPTSCTADSNCVSPNVCYSSGAPTPAKCGAKLTTGTACGTANDCASTWCYGTPKVCEANSCSDGIKDDVETDVDCGGGTCGDCAYGKACLVGGDCVTGVCASNGTCGCANDGECGSGEYCHLTTSLCTPKELNGTLCAGANECSSGFCADGVCCNSACNGECQACSATLQAPGNVEGTCGPAKTGTDPHGTCTGTCGNSLSAFTGTNPGTWMLNPATGGATYDTADNTVVLTDGAALNAAGTAIYQNPIVADSFTVTFDFKLTTTNVDAGTSYGRADGLAFMIETNGNTSVGTFGSGLGVSGLNGYGVELDLFDNALNGCTNEGNGNHAAIDTLAINTADGATCTTAALPTQVGTANSGNLPYDIGDGTWRTATISVTNGVATVSIGGSPLANMQGITLPGFTPGATKYYFGFGGGTGGLAARQEIRNVAITYPSNRCL